MRPGPLCRGSEEILAPRRRHHRGRRRRRHDAAARRTRRRRQGERGHDHDAGRELRCVLRSAYGRCPRGRARMAGHLRPASRVPRDGQAVGRGRLQRARRQSVLSADEGTDGTARRGDADPAARADDAGADADDARHRREGVRRVARCAPGSRQEQEDRHDRVLHGRPDRHAHGGSHTEPYRCRRLVPRRRPHHDESGQPAFADPADEGAVPDRRRRERRHARPDLEDDSQGRVRGREAECRDRGLPGRARLVPARQRRSTTRTSPRRPGAACSRCSRRRSRSRRFSFRFRRGPRMRSPLLIRFNGRRG